MSSVHLTVAVSDPDSGDSVRTTVSGLPTGLTATGPTISGTVSPSAENLTTSYQNIRTGTYTVTVTATDSHHQSTTATFAWRIRDTYTSMPDYIGLYGDGDGGTPDIGNALTQNHSFRSACDPTGDGNHIYRQSIAPGTPIAWGTQTITFWYGWTQAARPTCETVAKGWP